MMNKNKIYFGALEVIANILLGSKDLNISNYILKKDNLFLLWKVILIKNAEGVNNDKNVINTLDQNIIINNNYICPRFELNVFKKRTN